MAEAPSPRAPLPLPALPPRAADTHKGSYGTVLIVAGSRRYPGAAALAALGAGRAGAGLVQLALPAGLVQAVLPAAPFATVLSCAETDDGGLGVAAAYAVLTAAEQASAVVAGPGLGTHAQTASLLARLIEHAPRPLVLDADALNLLAADDGRLRTALAARTQRADHANRTDRTDGAGGKVGSVGPSTVLTPHPGELARLAAAYGWPEAKRAPTGDASRLAAAERLAQQTGAVVVLKGHGTVVSDGARSRVETAGNPGMAKAGMGDVLSGAIGALLAQVPARLPDAASAVALAVHAHAVAGDLAAAELGPEALLPEDVARLLGRALALPAPDR